MTGHQPFAEDHAEIREEVRKLCSKYPGAYWRDLDTRRAYPTEFVTELTKSGFLSVLIPEEFGGSGLGLSAAAAILARSGLTRREGDCDAVAAISGDAADGRR